MSSRALPEGVDRRSEEYVTVKQAAAICGISESTIRNEIRLGYLPARIPRGHVRGYRVRPIDVMGVLEEVVPRRGR